MTRAPQIANRFPVLPGSYLLWFYLPRGTEITIGRLGSHHFRRGWYFYCGSAFGSGGLRARLSHHLQHSEKLHWHIDYLKKWVRIRSVWLCCGINCEHDWSQLLLTLPGAELPLKGFGSSDCSCLSHLVYWSKKPTPKVVQTLLADNYCIRRFNLM